jgi:hypothetical protein
MDRAALIATEVERRGWHPSLCAWITDLCDGRQDRARLHCCNSGCLVCKREVLAVVALVEAEFSPPSTPPGRAD